MTVKPQQKSEYEKYVGLEHLPRGHTLLANWDSPEVVESNKYSFELGDVLFGKLRPYFKKAIID